MARPLNKKYFGNRNIGTNGYEGRDTNVYMSGVNPGNAGELTNFYPNADDGIGGEGVGGIQTITNAGAYLERIPTVTFSEPSLPGGVTATGVVTFVKATAAIPNNKGTGYQIGDLVEIVGGTRNLPGIFRVTKLRVLSATLSDAANSQQFDGGENLVWDNLVDSHWTTPTILTNVTSSGNPNYDITGWTTFSGGVWDGGVNHDPAPTGALTITGNGNGYNTRGVGDTLGGTADNNGNGGKVTFTYGIEAVELVSTGNYSQVLNEASTTINNTVGSAGVNATLDVFYSVWLFNITQKGSGYINAADAVPTFSETIDGAETQATATAYLTTDSYSDGTGYKQGNSNNQENAIIAYVYQEGERRIADIVEQTGSKRYVCITNNNNTEGDGKEPQTVYGYLVAHNAAKAYEIDMNATDYNGNTYFVTKLANHKATVARRTQYTDAVTYAATGYIDNNTTGGDGPGETFHLVSLDGEPVDLTGATVTWIASGGGTTTIASLIGSGEFGYVCYYVPGANVQLGSNGSPVAFTITMPGGTTAEWLFNNGDRVEWRLSNDITDYQVTIDNA